jgi:hypothetical protein
VTKIKNGIFLKLRGINIELENKRNPVSRVFKIV